MAYQSVRAGLKANGGAGAEANHLNAVP